MTFNFYPLSKSQLNIWNLEKAYPGTSINNICETIRLKGIFDIDCLQYTLNRIIEIDESLRTQISVDENNIPKQYIVPFVAQKFPVYDFTTSDTDEIKLWEREVTHEYIPVINSPLYYFAIIKVGENESAIIMKLHHLISDGWSQIELTNKISKIYSSRIKGQEAEIEAPPSYKLHIDTENQYLQSNIFERDKAYWKETLSGIYNPVSIKESLTADISPIGKRKSFILPEVFEHSIMAFSRENRVAPVALFYMAIAVYLKRIKGISKICIGVPIHNRASFTDKKSTGMFVNTMPFICDFNEDWDLKEFTDQYALSWFTMLKHQKLPFSEIMKLAKENNSDMDKIFNIVLSFHSSMVFFSDDVSVSFSGEWHYSGYQAEQLCIHVNHTPTDHRMTVNYDYLLQMFTEEEIENLHFYLINILDQALTYQNKSLKNLSLLNQNEEEKVLYEFNRTGKAFTKTTIWNKLSLVYSENADKVAVIYKKQRYTYKQLHEKSNAIAHNISSLIFEGKRVIATLLPKSFELYAALSGITQFGCAWVILSPEMPKPRLLDIINDSNACLLISNDEYLNKYDFNNIPTLNIDKLGSGAFMEVSCPVEPDDLAYIIYTSGSTGKPKGVEIGHKSFTNFAEAMQDIYSADGVISLCNITFDAFLIESAAALLNAKTIILPTDDEEENPAKLAELISSYAVGFMSLTPSRLSAFIRNEKFNKSIARIDSIICGGEAFPPELYKKLIKYTNARIYNQYGPSETTVAVTTALLNGSSKITIGKPMQNCKCYILDNQLRPLPIGIPGNLYISGECVGRGYRNLVELTNEKFIENPYTHNEILYKTGDIAAWTKTGEILIKGREDSQVKLRGQRIELEDISSRIAAHPRVRESVTRLVNHKGSDILVNYYSADTKINEGELIELAATYLPIYMIPSVFVHLKELPLNENKKIDVNKLPLDFNTGAGFYNGKINPAAEQILNVFRKVLKKPEMTAADEYFMFGGDSLNALETIAELEKIFNVRIRIADLYICKTALKLEKMLSSEDEKPEIYETTDIKKAPEKESYLLTPTQLGIYFESMLAPESKTYNMPCAFRIGEVLNIEKLSQALNKLIELEPIYRTAFIPENGSIVQKAAANCTVDVKSYKNTEYNAVISDFIKPFDLSSPPLIKLAVWFDTPNTSVILLDIHHIIGDAFTAFNTIKRLSELYIGIEQKAFEINYFDYSEWVNENLKKNIEEQRSFWQGYMDSPPELPAIPTDYPRPLKFDYSGKEYSYDLTSKESKIIDSFCEDNSITPYVLITSAFGYIVSKISNSTDIITGIPVSSRKKSQLNEIPGLFIRTMPLRFKINDEQIVSEFIENTKNNIISIIDNCDYPLDEIINSTAKKTGQLQNPLYNTMISMRPFDISNIKFAGKDVKFVSVPAGSAKVDINIEVSKINDKYNFRIEYSNNIFDESTIAFYARSLAASAVSMANNYGGKMNDCNCLALPDYYKLIEEPISCSTPFNNIPVDKKIDIISAINPDKIALISKDKKFTFEELIEKAEVLAGNLQKQGVAVGDKIGILCGRDHNLIISMLAILKTGAAYVPMLSSFPENRLKYMMETAGVKATLCDEQTLNGLPSGLPGIFLKIDTENNTPFVHTENRKPEDVCFVLFTSGSTGQPKGVKVKHRSISNLISVLKPVFDGFEGNVLSTTNSIFDIFFTESLMALANGKTVVLADEEEMLLPWKTASLITDYNIKMMQFTPSRANFCMEYEEFNSVLKNLSVMLLAGEALPLSLVKKIKAFGCNKVLNLYGPTEGTVYVSMDDVTNTEKVTIGTILPNCRGYVLDSNRKNTFPTAIGELYIAGECLSSGYIGREDLTEEYFTEDIYSSQEKMYRTGDLVRLLPNGKLDYIGRADHQIKLNGQRIELEEINEKIKSHPKITQAYTVCKNDGKFDYLCTYICTKNNEDIANDVIYKYAAEFLPKYMIPSDIIKLNKLPYTASGKIDLVKLKTIEKSDNLISAKENIPLTEQIEEIILQNEEKNLPDLIKNLWKQTLSLDEINDQDVSFFELGGTSMAALSLISHYYSNNLTMSLAQFYDNPSLNNHIEFFHNSKAISFSADKIIQTEEEIIPETVAEAVKKDAVLLTGATGFLGAHILKELIENGYKKVYCLIRKSVEKAESTLTYYFGAGWTDAFSDSYEFIHGDITTENLGLSDDDYAMLLERVAYVVHSAANVNHYSYNNALELTNCIGTVNAIKFSLCADAKLIHVSTISVHGEYIVNDPGRRCEYTENDYDIGQNWNENQYIKSKFIAEQYVYNAIEEEALNASVMRVGRLVGRSTDGVFQLNPEKNAFHTLIRNMFGYSILDQALADTDVELTPVDECAKAIVKLMNTNGKVYHIYNPDFTSMREIMKDLNHSIQFVSEEEFKIYISNRLFNGVNGEEITNIDNYNRFKNADCKIKICCDITVEKLKEQGFEWKPLNPSMILRKFKAVGKSIIK
ncbi:amino acid adenylation domain-containing protein [Eubacteriales bacterium OttesenSCG-928-G02]|nr:amino acid adenylation domain-containing protein [Eubacteriales bacterium OttesenSCG-928-G02]